VCTVTAGLEKVFHPNPAIGFLSHARRFGDAVAAGKILAPAKTMEDMTRVVFNDYLDATLAAVFVAVVLSMLVYSIINIRRALAAPSETTHEVGGGLPAAA
jgi:predicted deacylase